MEDTLHNAFKSGAAFPHWEKQKNDFYIVSYKINDGACNLVLPPGCGGSRSRRELGDGPRYLWHNQLHPSLRSLYKADLINILLLIPLQLSMAAVVLPWLWWCCHGYGGVAMAVVVLLWLRYG